MSNDKAQQLIEEASQAVAVRFVERFEWMAERCESPIERLFLAGLISSIEFSDLGEQVQFLKSDFTFGDIRKHPFLKADVYTQAIIGKYRVDFLIDDYIDERHRHYIVVECDGHDFHERTKEQARRDKARDRFFASQGIKVLRFTGSEIYADAERCAEEVLDHLTYQKFGPGGDNDRGSPLR